MAKANSLTTGTPSLVYDSGAVLADMPIEDLEALNLEFIRVRTEVQRWQQRINAAMSHKIEWENTIRHLDQMTPDAREHLLQVVRTKGVAPKEIVNG